MLEGIFFSGALIPEKRAGAIPGEKLTAEGKQEFENLYDLKLYLLDFEKACKHF